MMKPTTDTEVKAENEKASEAKNNDDINTQKVDTKDPNEQQDKAPEINVHVKTKKGCDTEEASPSSPGYNSATSGCYVYRNKRWSGNFIRYTHLAGCTWAWVTLSMKEDNIVVVTESVDTVIEEEAAACSLKVNGDIGDNHRGVAPDTMKQL